MSMAAAVVFSMRSRSESLSRRDIFSTFRAERGPRPYRLHGLLVAQAKACLFHSTYVCRPMTRERPDPLEGDTGSERDARLAHAFGALSVQARLALLRSLRSPKLLSEIDLQTPPSS